MCKGVHIVKILILLLFAINQIAAQQVSTFAGSGVAGSANGNGINAQFNSPYNLGIDTAGNLYICDTFNNLIRKIDVSANVTTFAGTGVQGHLDGAAGNARFYSPWGVCIGNNGEIIIGDNMTERLRKIENGNVTSIAGSGIVGNLLGPAMSAQFNKPNGVCIDNVGNIFFVDRYNNQVKKLDTSGIVSLVAGSGSPGFANGQGALASFNVPADIINDKNNNLYVSDRDNQSIRKISPTGMVTTFAGNGMAGFVNATGTQARFNSPHGIFLDACGNLYVADMLN
nr:hypothetical protein [Bacteroidota bacterium]